MTQTEASLSQEAAQELIKTLGWQHDMAGASYRLQALASLSHTISVARGWWPPAGRNTAEMIALMHSELSEMLEAVRTDRQSLKIVGYSEEEEEFADLLHRAFDYAAARGLRLDAFVAKAAYNLNRADHGAAARSAPGGKKF